MTDKNINAMKKFHFFTAILALLLLSGCMKDKNMKTYTVYRPEYSIKPEVKEAARLQEPTALKDLGNFVLYKNLMIINEKNKGLHVIDYRNPSSPVNKGFIPVPGNTGLAIRNDMLYADCYSDLFVFRISDDQDIRLQNSVTNVFLSRVGVYNRDTNFVQLTWIKKDTTVKVENYRQDSNVDPVYLAQTTNAGLYGGTNITPGGGTSVGSSMAVFTIVNDFLYAVDYSNLYSFSLKSSLTPVLENKQKVSWDVETIFPFKDKLFIGSMTGMYIYSIDNPAAPSYISQFNHVRVCDPVIADDKFAFVTLRNGTQCGGFVNQLDVISIENISNPVIQKSFPFSNPHGLSKDGNVLFVCDGDAGLKVLDASNVNNIVTKQSLSIGKAIDVIAHHEIAFVMLEDAIKLYSYDQQFHILPLGSITKN